MFDENFEKLKIKLQKMLKNFVKKLQKCFQLINLNYIWNEKRILKIKNSALNQW